MHITTLSNKMYLTLFLNTFQIRCNVELLRIYRATLWRHLKRADLMSANEFSGYWWVNLKVHSTQLAVSWIGINE